MDIAYGEHDLIRLARALEALARAIEHDNPVAAVRLASAAGSIRLRSGAVAWPSDRRHLDLWFPDVQRQLSPHTYTTALTAGRSLLVDQAVAFACRSVDPKTDMLHVESAPLTRRERDVLIRLARAQSNQQIAGELNISVATARTHVENILSKLHLHSRAQAVVWASEHAVESTQGR